MCKPLRHGKPGSKWYRNKWRSPYTWALTPQGRKRIDRAIKKSARNKSERRELQDG
jgi:hypothetical protein